MFGRLDKRRARRKEDAFVLWFSDARFREILNRDRVSC